MKVVLTGGGTGGHIYPALAIGDHLRAMDSETELLYIGTKKGLESQILQWADIPLKTVWASGLSRKINLAFFKALLKTFIGTLQAIKHLRKFKPDIVIGTGGFVCAPTILAARLLRIPCLLHEQNAYPGLTNRLLAPICSAVMTNFSEVGSYLSPKAKIIETGLPIRESILMLSKDEAMESFGLDKDKKTLLVTGGSRGAKSINDAMVGVLEKLLKYEKLQIIFATGKDNYEEVLAQVEKLSLSEEKRKRLILKSYLHDMPHALVASDIVLSRAGATFIAEMTILALPGILVPYPFASENHQMYNAKAIVQAGGAELIEDSELNPLKLEEMLKPFLSDEDYYYSKKAALEKIAHRDVLEKIRKVVMETKI